MLISLEQDLTFKNFVYFLSICDKKSGGTNSNPKRYKLITVCFLFGKDSQV